VYAQKKKPLTYPNLNLKLKLATKNGSRGGGKGGTCQGRCAKGIGERPKSTRGALGHGGSNSDGRKKDCGTSITGIHSKHAKKGWSLLKEERQWWKEKFFSTIGGRKGRRTGEEPFCDQMEEEETV